MRNFFKGIEQKTPMGLKLLIGVIVVSAVSLATLFMSSEEKNITEATVMITSMNERGGGSGVIISAGESESVILTNRHVCLLAERGGLVKTNDGGRHLITSYAPSDKHDLCLVRVAAKLNAKAKIASNAPIMFEAATVSGHPSLLPNVLTKGHFSGKKIIQVLTGARECTKEELDDRVGALVCAFFNGMPVIHTAESILVTATIMPGSSGSAVYNENQELSAVVFAGQGELGYAFAVPFEYVEEFLYSFTPKLNPKYETTMLESANGQSAKSYLKNCKTKKLDSIDETAKRKIEAFCKVIIRDATWRTTNENFNVTN